MEKMITTMKSRMLLLLLLLTPFVLAAQPNMKLGLVENPAHTVEVHFLPDASYTGWVSAAVITVRWNSGTTATVGAPQWVDATTGEFMTGNSGTAIPPLTGSSGYLTSSSGGYDYLTVVTINSTGSTSSWVAGTEAPILYFPVTNANNDCLKFQLVTGAQDPYVLTNNLDWYLAFAGTEKQNGFITGKTNLWMEDTAPTFSSCPSNTIVATEAGVCVATVSGLNPGASDNCALDQLSWTITGATTATGIGPLTSYPFNSDITNAGVSTVTYTALDSSGNTATCSFTVEVVDN